MSLTRINEYTRLPAYFLAHHILDECPMVVCDVGARNNFEPHWKLFGRQAHVIGFEPDKEECRRIANSLPAHRAIYPFALYKSKTKKTFYNAHYPNSSGFYAPNENLVKRFPDWQNVEPLSTSEIEVTDFDSFAQEYNINYVDFIKLDAEGAELDVLEGMNHTLNSVLGVSIEVLFLPFREYAPTFERVQAFMLSRGFFLYDLELYRHVRNNFPWRFHPKFGTSCFGQITWGQALYFRDLVAEIQSGKTILPEHALKMLALLELFYLNDCAFELLEICRSHNILSERISLELEKSLQLRKPDLQNFVQQREDFLRSSFGNILPEIQPLS